MTATTATPLHALTHAIWIGDLEAITIIRDSGITDDSIPGRAFTFAAERGKIQALHVMYRWLLDLEARTPPARQMDLALSLAMMYATKNGHASVIKWLMKWGAKMTQADKVCAAKKGFTAIWRLLGPDQVGWAELHAAVVGGQLEVLDLMLSWRASSDEAAVPLEFRFLEDAAASGKLTVMTRLRRFCAGYNLQTAFVAAAKNNSLAAMAVLRAWGSCDYHYDVRLEAIRKPHNNDVIDYHHALRATEYPEARTLLRLYIYMRNGKAQHGRLLDVYIAIAPLGLPSHVATWLVDWVVRGPLTLAHKVKMLDRVRARRH